VFDRLYDDWSALERFQRTRGVLRFMAATIHELWTRNDQSPLIMPGSIPLDAPAVREELLRHLTEGWDAVVATDIDGERSEPLRTDKENQRFGEVSAARRVARTIFLGSAPSVKQQRVRGIEDVRIRLGVVQPGEQVATFNDALRRTVEDRAGRMKREEVELELERRVRADRSRGEFRAVHPCPSSADVPEDQAARLVVLSPQQHHRRGQKQTLALQAAAEILEKRGNSPRQFQNMLVFVAPDEGALEGLEHEVRRYLAWKSVVQEHEALNLDAYQRRQAAENEKRSDDTVTARLQEAYAWLLVPTQEGGAPIEWEVSRRWSWTGGCGRTSPISPPGSCGST
jgi:hypothetical protein